MLLTSRHALVVFGGLQGLEAAVDTDPNLEVAEPSVLFDLYVNTCPSQGSRTIRTEVSARACPLRPGLAQRSLARAGYSSPTAPYPRPPLTCTDCGRGPGTR